MHTVWLYLLTPKELVVKVPFVLLKHQSRSYTDRQEYNYDSFTYQLARKEFDKSNKEKLTEITAAKARVTDSDRLVRFLTTKCNYTLAQRLKNKRN